MRESRCIDANRPIHGSFAVLTRVDGYALSEAPATA
jgi:hypothetical protein